MAKVFSGKDFLAQRSVKIDLSNGTVATVSELSDDALTVMDELGKKEDASPKEIRRVVAKMLGKEASALEGIGVVELRGVMDFLSKSLFE